MTDVPMCSICDGPLYEGNPEWKDGNNADPFTGRCCDACNLYFVIPARMGDKMALKLGHKLQGDKNAV